MVIWLDAFRTGTHTSSEGNTHSWTKADIDQIVDSYNPEIHEAPVVLGHPKTDDPAYGWIKAARRVGDRLQLAIDDLQENFKQALQDKRYKKVSISLFPPNYESNPTPGKWHLKHLGFLGATLPAVTGLKPIALNGDYPGVVYEFQEPEPDTVFELSHHQETKKLKPMKIDRFLTVARESSGLSISTLNELTDIPVKSLESFERGDTLPSQEELDSLTLAFSSAPKQSVLSQDKTESSEDFNQIRYELDQQKELLAKQKAGFDRQREEINKIAESVEFQRERLDAERKQLELEKVTAFTGQLVREFKLLPEQQEKITQLIINTPDSVENFAIEDSSPRKILIEYFESLSPRVSNKPLGSVEDDPLNVPVSKRLNFNMPDGMSIDNAQADLYRKAMAIREQHPDWDFVRCASEAEKGGV